MSAPSDMKVRMSFFKDKRGTERNSKGALYSSPTEVVGVTHDTFLDAFTSHEVTDCVPDCHVLKDPACPHKSDGESFSPAIYGACPADACLSPGKSAVGCDGGRVHAINANVQSVTFTIFDQDGLTPDESDAHRRKMEASGYRGAVSSTHNHGRPGKGHRLRTVILVSREMSAAEYPAVRAQLVRELGLVKVDPASESLRQVYYSPTTPKGGPAPIAYRLNGQPVDVDALLERAKAAGAPPLATSTERRPTNVAHAFPPASPAVLEAAGAALTKHGPAIQDKRGDTHTVRAGALLGNDWGLAEEEIWPLATEWNARCEPPWEEDELRVKLENGRVYAKGPYGAARTMFEMLEERRTAKAPEPGSFEAEVEQARKDLEDRRSGGKGTDGKARPLFGSAVDLLHESFAKTLWLVVGLLVVKTVAVISGEPKTTKTWAGLELAIAIATATLAFREFPTGGPAQPVALFLAEDSRQSARARLCALAKGRGLDPEKALEKVHIECQAAFNLQDDTALATFVASARRIRPALVIIDPLRDVHGADEDKSGPMADVMDRLRSIRDLCECSVVFVHHLGKATRDNRGNRAGQRMRGSSAIHGSVEGGLYFRDLKGDKATCFENVAEVELKAARGAGEFTVRLDVEDSPFTQQAEKATWTISRPDTEAERSEEADRLKWNTLDILRDAPGPLSADSVRKLIEKSAEAAREALKGLKDDGLAVQLPKKGWTVTDAGRAVKRQADYDGLSRTRSAAVPDGLADSLPIGESASGPPKSVHGDLSKRTRPRSPRGNGAHDISSTPTQLGKTANAGATTGRKGPNPDLWARNDAGNLLGDGQ